MGWGFRFGENYLLLIRQYSFYGLLDQSATPSTVIFFPLFYPSLFNSDTFSHLTENKKPYLDSSKGPILLTQYLKYNHRIPRLGELNFWVSESTTSASPCYYPLGNFRPFVGKIKETKGYIVVSPLIQPLPSFIPNKESTMSFLGLQKVIDKRKVCTSKDFSNSPQKKV